MGTPLDDIRFLSASENRVRILEYLRETRANRQELHEQLDISRPTISRVISGLRARGWVVESGAHCEITSLGASFVGEFTDLVTLAETIQRLRDLRPWLPLEEMDLGPRHFQDANISTITKQDPSAPMGRVKELTRRAEDIRVLTHMLDESLVEVMWERTVYGDLTATLVITHDVVAMLRHNAETARLLSETIDTGQVGLYLYSAEIAHLVTVIDDSRAGILLQDDDGVVRAELDTHDEAFREWVESTFERHRQDAEPIAADVFTA